MEIVPEANFGIEICKNGTPQRNAPFLCAESDYLMHYQVTWLPYPDELIEHLQKNRTCLIRE